MQEPVGVGVSGLFRAAPALRRRWAELAAFMPAFHRVRAAPWLAGLPTAEQVDAVVAEVAGEAGVRPFGLLAHPGAAAALDVWPVSVGGGEGPLVALVGPESVDAAVDAAVAAGRRVAVACPAMGEPIDPPAGGVWIDDAWAGEGGRGVFALGLLAVARSRGADVAAGLRGAARMHQAVQDPLATNAAWTLARALRAAAVELGRDRVVHLAGPELAAHTAWAARTQATVRSATSSAAAPRPLPSHADAGDEDWLRAIVASREVVVVLWQAGNGPSPVVEALSGEGTPVLLVHLAANDAESRGAALSLWLSALYVLAVLEQRIA